MGERKTVLVTPEEIEIQKGFIRTVLELNGGRPRKYTIHTFGCQMNENDSERLSGMLAEMGYTPAETIEESDLIIFNTCCVRENAEDKVFGHLGALKHLKAQRPELILAVCGCMMQQDENVQAVRKKFRHVDLIFGTHNLHKFPELLHNAIVSKETIIDVWESTGSIAEGMPIQRKEGVKAWVTVMYGCNNFCSYCIVPYVRGRERSRQMEDIAEEVKVLGQQGYKEITLLGQNVNSYGKDLEDGSDFAQLLRRLDGIEGIERIRFMTSHPKDLSDALIHAMKECKKVCEHLHLPIQSGSTKVLEEMNRKYSKEQYLALADKLKKEIPDIALTTDIIVGFPGETEEDFAETLDVMRRVRYDSAYTFLYSKRSGTPAAKRQEQVEEAVMKERFQRLLELQNTISKELNMPLAGQVVEVLVEGPSRSNPDVLTGRTRNNKIVNFTGGADLIGQLVQVRIEGIQTWSLEGVLV